MKTQKFPSCRSAQDLNADEMKQAAETPIQASDSSNETDSKSGTGTTGPGVTKPEDERELQAKACEGKNSMTHVHGTPMAQITQAFAIIASAIKPIIVHMFHQQVLVPELEACRPNKRHV